MFDDDLGSLRDWAERREAILRAEEDEMFRAARDGATTDERIRA